MQRPKLWRRYEEAWTVSRGRCVGAKRALARRAFERGDWASCGAHSAAALAAAPLSPGTAFLAGCAAMRGSEWEAAARAFSRVVQQASAVARGGGGGGAETDVRGHVTDVRGHVTGAGGGGRVGEPRVMLPAVRSPRGRDGGARAGTQMRVARVRVCSPQVPVGAAAQPRLVAALVKLRAGVRSL